MKIRITHHFWGTAIVEDFATPAEATAWTACLVANKIPFELTYP